MLASLDDVSKSYADQQVLTDVSAQIHENDRIGLIGRNGAGKSTLISILLGTESADEGDVFLRGDARIGYLKQDTGLEADGTVVEEMRSVFSEALAAQKRMDELATVIEKEPDNLNAQRSYDAAMSAFLAQDGYNIDVKIRRVLGGMGFGEKSDDTVIRTMSGGEKTRLALARLLLQEPELLILDEPTNHLDMATLSWLEGYLGSYKGALLVVSHDRFFLDKVTLETWEIEDGYLETYSGSYSKYRTLKKERTERRLKEYEKQRRQIADMEDYVARNMARASTSGMAKSREKQLEKMEKIRRPRTRMPVPSFSFQMGKKPWSDVLEVDQLTLTVGEEKRKIAEGISLSVRRGDRVGIIGPNGSGKSTFLRALVAAGDGRHGAISWGRGVETGYYEQENRDLQPEAMAVAEVVRRAPHLLEADARSLLGRVLLTGDDVFKRVSDLSGGERAKLELAILMAGDANVLLLDEPTNHLDLPAREALEDALQKYEGTLIFVSHDRYFINALAQSTLAIEDGHGFVTEGNYDAYVVAKETQSQVSVAKGVIPQNSGKARSQKEQRRIDAKRRQDLYEAETRIAKLEQEEGELKKLIAENPTDYAALEEACARLEQVTTEHEQAMEAWMLLAEEDSFG